MLCCIVHLYCVQLQSTPAVSHQVHTTSTEPNASGYSLRNGMRKASIRDCVLLCCSIHRSEEWSEDAWLSFLLGGIGSDFTLLLSFDSKYGGCCDEFRLHILWLDWFCGNCVDKPRD